MQRDVSNIVDGHRPGLFNHRIASGLVGFAQDFGIQRIHQFLNDEQTEAGPARSLGREEEAERLFTGLSIHADAVVLDLELNVIW